MLILMRGWQGSGKSTLAKRIADAHSNSVIFSTDDYWIHDGQYQFVPELITVAHKWNIERTATYCQQNPFGVVIIDNTNIQLEHMAPYIAIAQDVSCAVAQAIPFEVTDVLRLLRSDDDADKQFAWAAVRHHASRNIHGVPERAVFCAVEQWEDSTLPMFDFGFTRVCALKGE